MTADKTWGGFGLGCHGRHECLLPAVRDTLSGYTQGGHDPRLLFAQSVGQSGPGREHDVAPPLVSLYGKATLSWKSMAYVDVTARNDWSSSASSRVAVLFLDPSVAGSFILTEVLPKMRGVDLLKVRGSVDPHQDGPRRV